MAYRACFHCQLLFEVDAVDAAAELACPQCGRPVEPYDPEDEETEAPEATVTVEPGVSPDLDPAIVKTMAFDGLSDAVRQRTAQAQAARAAPAAPEPSRPADPFPARAGRTRVLGAVDEAGRPVEPAPQAPTAPQPRPAARPRPVEAPIAPTASLPFATPAARADAAKVDSGRQQALPAVDLEKGRSTLPPPGARRGRGLGIVLALLVLGGGGATAWWFFLRSPPPPAAVPGEEAPVLAWDARIEQQLEDGEAKLPSVSGPDALQEGGAWIAGGPEGLQASFGPIAGLPSTLIRETMLESDADGEWVGVLAQHLARETLPAGQPLAFGLPAELATQDLLRLAYAGVKGGVGEFALLVARNSGGLGALPFRVLRAADQGAGLVLVLRIGRTNGFHVTVQEGGEIKSSEPRILPRRADDGRLDQRALRERLDELVAAHEGLSQAVIHPLSDMPVGELAEVLAVLRGTESKPRFAPPRIALR